MASMEDFAVLVAEDLDRLETRVEGVEKIVDRIKFPPFSKGKPVGDAPPGTLVLDVETFDVWEATE